MRTNARRVAQHTSYARCWPSEENVVTDFSMPPFQAHAAAAASPAAMPIRLRSWLEQRLLHCNTVTHIHTIFHLLMLYSLCLVNKH